MRGFATFATIVLLAGAAGCGSDDDPAATTNDAAVKSPSGGVDVVMKEFTIKPTPASVPAGKVTFSVSNQGKLKHEFVVLKTTKAAGDLLKGDEADETGNVGEIGDLPPSSSKKLSLMLKPGHYALICNLTGHYKAGQFADFSVK